MNPAKPKTPKPFKPSMKNLAERELIKPAVPGVPWEFRLLFLNPEHFQPGALKNLTEIRPATN